MVKEESAWCKVRKDIPVEYAATAFVNPCTALRMLEDFVTLTEGPCNEMLWLSFFKNVAKVYSLKKLTLCSEMVQEI